MIRYLAYADPRADLGLPPRTEDDARVIAATLPLHESLRWIAEIAQRTYQSYGNRVQHFGTAQLVFAGSRHHQAVTRLLARREVFAFGVSQIFEAIRFVVLYGDPEATFDQRTVRRGVAELIITALSTADLAAAQGAGMSLSEGLRMWLTLHAEIPANEYGSRVAIRLIELELLERVAVEHRASTTTLQMLRQKVGAEQDLLAAGFVASAISTRGQGLRHLVLGDETFTDNFAHRWALARPALVTSVDALRDRIKDQPRMAVVEELRRRPLIETPEGNALIISPWSLDWWLSEGVRDRVETDLEELGFASPSKLRGAAAELALHEWMVEIDPSALCCEHLTISGDTKYDGDEPQVDSADMHLCCPHGTVVVELHSGNTPTRPGTDAREVISRASEKPHQLIRPIRDLRDGLYRRPAFTRRVPIRAVALDDRVPVQNRGVPSAITDAISHEARLLHSEGVASLTVMCMDDWIRLIGKVENSRVYSIHSALAAMAEWDLAGPPYVTMGGPDQFMGDGQLFTDHWYRPSSIESRVETLTTGIRESLFPAVLDS